MRVGDRVKVVAHWSEFRGMVGEVVQVDPCVMVHFEREAKPIRVDVVSLKLEESEL